MTSILEHIPLDFHRPSFFSKSFRLNGMPGGFLGIRVTDGIDFFFTLERNREDGWSSEVQEMVVETLALDFILFDAHRN